MKEISPWRIRRVAEAGEIEPEYFYTSDSEEVRLGDYWNILVKRRHLIILFFLLVFGVGSYFTLSATTLYTARATVKIEPHNPEVTGVGGLESLFGGGERYDYYQTQFALLESRSLAARVVKELDLESNEAFKSMDIVEINPIKRVQSWVFRILRHFSYYLAPLFEIFKTDQRSTLDSLAIKSEATPNDAALDIALKVDPRVLNKYQGLLYVDHVGKTRLVEVNFTTPDPTLSQALANAHVRNFLRMGLDNRFSLTEEAREFLNKKKTELAQKLEKSEEALNRFRRAAGVVSVEKGENIVVDRLVEINRQLTAARAQRIEAESLYRIVENRDYQDLAEVMREGLVQQLKSNVAKLESERARLSTIFKPEHPRIQELGQQIAQANRALNNEIANVVRGIKSGYAAAQAKERGLEAEAERQQKNALKLKELGVQYTLLQEEVNANKSLYENVLKRLSATDVSNDIAVSNMQIVGQAEKPLGPSGPNVPGYLLAYVLLGAMFSIGIGFLCEFFDSTVSTPDEVWRAVGLNTLGVVPDLKFLNRRQYSPGRLSNGEPRRKKSLTSPPKNPTAKELIVSQPSISIVSESYRAIRTAFLLSQAEKPPQVVVLTSPAPGEGKTLTTLNLAIALAHDGHAVLVIDGDLRRGCCHSRLGLQNNKGLANVLTGQLTLEDGVRETSIDRLSLLSRGILPPNPTELLGSRKMKEVLNKLRQEYKFILIDSPPVVAVSDAAVLSVLSDGVLLVLDGQKTSSASTRKAVERLEMVRARMLGVVLNGVNLDNPDYSYYRSYSSYYAPTNEQESDQEPTVDNVESVDKVLHVSEVAARNEKWELGKQSDSAPSRGMTQAEEAVLEEGAVRNEKSNLDARDDSAVADPEEEKLSQSEIAEEFSSSEKQPPAAQEVLAPRSIDRIVQTLSDTIGPIAPLIVRDRIALMGESQDAFPKRRLLELLRAISGEIAHEKLRSVFQKRISEEISELDKL